MPIVNAILRAAFDGLLYPFRTFHPLVGLVVVSFLSTIAVLPLVKATSNQQALETVKRHIHAGWFEIRLFSDDLQAIMRAQLNILRHNLTYLRLWLVPMLWMIVPFALVVAQLQFHYGYEGLELGEQTLVKVQLKEGRASERPALALVVPDGLRVETPPVWIPSQGEMAWRMAAEEWGDYELEVKLGGESWAKSVRVTEDVVRRSPIRVAPSFWQMLLYPAEDPLPDGSPIESITIDYREVRLFAGVPLWMIGYFILMVIFAFALRNRFGVTL